MATDQVLEIIKEELRKEEREKIRKEVQQEYMKTKEDKGKYGGCLILIQTHYISSPSKQNLTLHQTVKRRGGRYRN